MSETGTVETVITACAHFLNLNQGNRPRSITPLVMLLGVVYRIFLGASFLLAGRPPPHHEAQRDVLFMDRIRESAVRLERRSVQQRLENSLKGMRSLLTEITKEDPLTWDLRLQASKEMAEMLTTTFPTLSVERQWLLDLLWPLMMHAENDLVLHLHVYQGENKRKLGRILELARLAICGHRVCWETSHVLRTLTPMALNDLTIWSRHLPHSAQLADLIALANLGPSTVPPCSQFIVHQGASSSETDLPSPQAPPHPEYRSLRLPNGLKVLLCSDPNSSLGEMALRINAGQYQDKGTPGLAHLAEHIIMSQNNNELIDFCFLRGQPCNGITDLEGTMYWCCVCPDLLEEAMQLLVDLFLDPQVTDELLEREITIIQLELMARLNLRAFQFLQLARLGLNPHHPDAVVLEGTTKTLKVPHIKALVRQFLTTNYVANNMTLAVKSPKSLDCLQELVQRYFKYVPCSTFMAAPISNIPIQWFPNGYVHAYDMFANAVMFQWKGIKYKPTDRRLKSLLDATLTAKDKIFGHSYNFNSSFGYNGDLIIHIIFFVKKETFGNIPAFLEHVKMDLEQLASSFQPPLAQPPLEKRGNFVCQAAEMLATMDMAHAKDIPQLVLNGPSWDAHARARVTHIIHDTCSRNPQIFLLTRDSPSSHYTDLFLDSITGKLVAWRPESDLFPPGYPPMDLVPTSAPSVMQLSLTVSPMISHFSKVVFLGELIKKIAHRHQMKANYVLDSKNRLRLTVLGNPHSSWSMFMVDFMHLFVHVHPSHSTKVLLSRAFQSARKRLEALLQNETFTTIGSSLVFDILTMTFKMLSFHPKCGSDQAVYSDLVLFAAFLLKYGQLTMQCHGLTEPVISTLVQQISKGLGINVKKIPSTTATYSSPPSTPRRIPYSILAPGVPWLYIPPCMNGHDSALVAFFQFPSEIQPSPVISKPDLLVALHRICQTMVNISLRRSLKISYSPLVVRDNPLPGLLFTVQGTNPPCHLYQSLEHTLSRLPDFIQALSLSSLQGVLRGTDRDVKLGESSWVNLVRSRLLEVASKSLSPHSKERSSLWLQFWPSRLEKEREIYLRQLYDNQSFGGFVFTTIT